MNLLADQAYFAGVELDQVTQFDGSGRETGRFPGEANARFLYSIEGLRVAGGGAKTYAFYNPGEYKPKLSGAFHCWREIQNAITVKTTPIDEVLDNALAGDREIAAYQDKGYDILITKIELVYYSRPPYKFQDYLFPALNVLGVAVPQDEKLKDLGVDIVKFYHAIPISKYVEAGFAADYLVNRI